MVDALPNKNKCGLFKPVEITIRRLRQKGGKWRG
jgi:hypothetical protein